MISEGSRVAFAGDDPRNDIGAVGKVLSMTGSTGAHVQWETGPMRGVVEPQWLDDLVPYRGATQASVVAGAMSEGTSPTESFDNNLDSLGAPGLKVRAVYDDEGEDGLVSALNEAGKIAILAEYTDEALAVLCTRIRHDPNFGEVLATLETDEADSLVNRVASLLLVDRTSEDD